MLICGIVTAFAKKTGDYGSLSPVDLKVMALTHQLLCEQDPEKVSQLKATPAKEVCDMVQCVGEGGGRGLVPVLFHFTVIWMI